MTELRLEELRIATYYAFVGQSLPGQIERLLGHRGELLYAGIAADLWLDKIVQLDGSVPQPSRVAA